MARPPGIRARPCPYGVTISGIPERSRRMSGPDYPPPTGVDTGRPSVARMYDYYLGGKDNFQVDRDAVARVEAAMPEVRQLARENRAFLRRVVRYMARQGIEQFIDIGSGLPTAGNTHEIARQVI